MAQNDINVKINVDAGQAQKQTNLLEEKLGSLKTQMENLALAGKQNTDEFKKVQSEYASLVDLSGDLSAAANILADDYFKQRAAMEGLSVGLNIFSGITQAAALCGAENEDLQKVLVKLQAAQNLANTAMNIAQALNKDTALMVALRDIKEKLLTKTIQSETKSQLALNAAKAGAIGVIVALTAAVVALGVAYIKSKNSIEAVNRELNKQSNEAVTDNVIKINNLKEGWDKLGDSLEERKKYLDKNAESLEQMGLHFNDVNEAEEFFRNHTEKYLEAMTERAKAAAAQEMILEQQKQLLTNQNRMEEMLSDEASWWDKFTVSMYGGEEAIRNLHSGLEGRTKNNIKRLAELKQKAEETAAEIEKTTPGYESPEAKKKREDDEKEAEQAAERAAEERKRQRNELNKFIEDGQKAELQREKDLNKETHEGRLKNIEIEKQETTSLYDQKIADAEKLFGKDSEQVQQLKVLKEKALTELQNKRLIEIQTELEAQKKAENEKKAAADEKKAADEKAQKESERAATDSAMRTAKAEADARLIGLKEGSEEYNNALKEQYKAEYDIALEELNRQHEDSLISEEEYLAQLALLNAEYRQKETDLDAEAIKRRNEARFAATENIVNQLGNLTQSMMDAELEAVGNNEKKQAEIKRRYAKMNFLSQIAAIGIDTAKGIMSVWSTAGEAGPILGPILGAVQTALIIGTGIAQTIKAKNAMNKALSGKAARGAFINGRSHAQGGVLWELEGGEAVLNKKAMAIPSFRALASAMNESTGGVSFNNTITTQSQRQSLLSVNVPDDAIRSIVAETVAGIVSIPVTVTESSITNAQRNVSVIENRSSF